MLPQVPIKIFKTLLQNSKKMSKISKTRKKWTKFRENSWKKNLILIIHFVNSLFAIKKSPSLHTKYFVLYFIMYKGIIHVYVLVIWQYTIICFKFTFCFSPSISRSQNTSWFRIGVGTFFIYLETDDWIFWKWS